MLLLKILDWQFSVPMPILLTLLIISLNCEREKAFCFEVFILPYNINDGLALSEVASLTDPLLFCIYLYTYVYLTYTHVRNIMYFVPHLLNVVEF